MLEIIYNVETMNKNENLNEQNKWNCTYPESGIHAVKKSKHAAQNLIENGKLRTQKRWGPYSSREWLELDIQWKLYIMYKLQLKTEYHVMVGG